MTDNSNLDPNISRTHRAWTWQGGAEPLGLVLKTVELPALSPGDVVVRNAAIGLNPVDWKVLGNTSLNWSTGHIPGVDGAGTVVAVAEDVSSAWLGARVAYHQNLMRAGSFAESTVIASRALMRLPDSLDFTFAAAFPCPALTAWQALDKLPVHAGADVLISGAGGAVGHYLVQLAAARGFRVTAMCNRRHWERLNTFGAARCIAGPLAEGEVMSSAGREGHSKDSSAAYFAIIDSVGADHASRLTPALRAGGHIVCIQGRLEEWPCPPFGRTLSLHEVALGALHQYGDDDDWHHLTAAGEALLAEIAASKIRTEELVIKPFSELPVLLDSLRNRRFSGKAVVSLD